MLPVLRAIKVAITQLIVIRQAEERRERPTTTKNELTKYVDEGNKEPVQLPSSQSESSLACCMCA